tara:strand:- start:231 stop:1163 length:933 start_codon:yes stop_codon:yes gene_type:complete
MLKNKHLLSLKDLSKDDILQILDFADVLKKEKQNGVYRNNLSNKSLAIILNKPSTRTKVSFELAMYELGGHVINLNYNDLQLSRSETIEDTANALSCYINIIVARTNHSDLIQLSNSSKVPIINGLSELYHPCQILSDLQTIREFQPNFSKTKITWIGDGNNVCNSLILGCAKLGISVTISCPKGYEPDSEVLNYSKTISQTNDSNIEIIYDPNKAVIDSTVIMTDTFVSMGDESEKEIRLKSFLPKYQVNSKLLKNASADYIFMHCLPAHRDHEVTNDVIDGKHSVVWQEAENRLHIQKSLLYLILNDQ